MNIEKQKYLLIIISVAFIWSFRSVASLPEIKFSGYLNSYIATDTRYHNPNSNSDWSWELWNNRRNFDPSYSHIAGWGGMRLNLTTTVGGLSDSIYIYYPMDLRIRMQEQSKSKVICVATNYNSMFRGKLFAFSMTSERINENPLWSFISIDDPLGAMKLPNTSYPVMTTKLIGNIGGWETIGYYIADTICNFVPATEMIPTKARDALGKGEYFQYYDEAPTYQLLRATKNLYQGWTLGFLLGRKNAINVYPRFSDSDNTVPRTANGIGFSKQNIGFDLRGVLPLEGEPKIEIASISSMGEWRKYKKEQGFLENAISWDGLGELMGSATKITFSGIKFGSAHISGSYHFVEPSFQWIAVRDHRYAYTIGFNDLNNPIFSFSGTYGWRAIKDEEFVYRDYSRKEDYLSELSMYLGLRVSNLEIVIPGYVKFPLNKVATQNRSISRSLFKENVDVGSPAKLSFRLDKIENLNGGELYSDPITGDEVIKDYWQLRTALNVKYNPNSNLEFYVRQKDFLRDQDYHHEVGGKFDHRFYGNLILQGETGLIKRLRDDDSFGEGFLKYTGVTLKGITKQRIKLESKIDYRYGTYDRDLIKGAYDCVLETPYSYVRISQYMEFNTSLRLGEIKINTKLAGEYIELGTVLPGIAKRSAIGFIQGNIPLSNKISTSIIGIGIKERPALNSITNIVDWNLTYNPFGNGNNVLTLRFTNRYFGNSKKSNCTANWLSRVGRNYLSFSYGKQPFLVSPKIYGTVVDSRFQPEKELIDRPWTVWGNNSIYSEQTHLGSFTMSWVIVF